MEKDYVWGAGHFMTPFCDLCLRLHLDSKVNIIDDIHKWWFDGSCQEASILSNELIIPTCFIYETQFRFTFFFYFVIFFILCADL